jgi:hypothetical protein
MTHSWDEMLASDYKPNSLQLMNYPFRFPHLVKYQKSTFQDFLDKFIQDNKLLC